MIDSLNQNISLLIQGLRSTKSTRFNHSMTGHKPAGLPFNPTEGSSGSGSYWRHLPTTAQT
jgi:hypothetical protein